MPTKTMPNPTQDCEHGRQLGQRCLRCEALTAKLAAAEAQVARLREALGEVREHVEANECNEDEVLAIIGRITRAALATPTYRTPALPVVHEAEARVDALMAGPRRRTTYSTGSDTWEHGQEMSPGHIFLGPCPVCGSRAFDYGGGWRCTAPHCGNGANNSAPNVGPAPGWWDTGVNVCRDGRSWRAVGLGFVNLQESSAGFGDTPADAVMDLTARTVLDASTQQSPGRWLTAEEVGRVREALTELRDLAIEASRKSGTDREYFRMPYRFMDNAVEGARRALELLKENPK